MATEDALIIQRRGAEVRGVEASGVLAEVQDVLGAEPDESLVGEVCCIKTKIDFYSSF